MRPLSTNFLLTFVQEFLNRYHTDVRDWTYRVVHIVTNFQHSLLTRTE